MVGTGLPALARDCPETVQLWGWYLAAGYPFHCGQVSEPTGVYVPSLVLGLVIYFIVIYPAVHFRFVQFSVCLVCVTHRTRPWCWERLKAGGDRGRQRTRCLGSITNSMDMSLSKLREIVKDKKAWHAVVHRVAKSWTRLSNWTTTACMTVTRANTEIHKKLRVCF